MNSDSGLTITDFLFLFRQIYYCSGCGLHSRMRFHIRNRILDPEYEPGIQNPFPDPVPLSRFMIQISEQDTGSGFLIQKPFKNPDP
jgi:hypothetical protein